MNDYENSEQNANNALSLGAKLNFKKGQAIAYRMKGYSTPTLEVTLHYFDSSIQFAKESKDLSVIYYSYLVKGQICRSNEKFNDALHSFLEAVKLAELLKNKNNTAYAYMEVGGVYLKLGNTKELLRNYEIALKLFSELNAHVAEHFKDINKLDSALVYARRGLAYRSLGSEGDAWSGDLRNLADIFKELKQDDSALYYYKATVGPSVRLGVSIDAFDAYLGIARIFQHMERIDSSIYYASKALAEFSSLQYPKGRFLAAEVLTQNYQTYKQSDSTLKYLRLSLTFKDSLYSQEKMKAFQNISFNERMREQEIRQERIELRSRTKTYLFAGGLFTLLIIAGLLYRNNLQKQKAKTKVEKAYTELKTTQQQLIQSEKMASLGEMTAGIAHEIQNPLNFVNNFSEVNKELIEELKIKNEKLKITDKEVHGETIFTTSLLCSA